MRPVARQWGLRLGKRAGYRTAFRRQLVEGAVGSLAIKLGYVFLQFATSMVLARTLAPEGYGIYSWVTGLMALLIIPVQLGFPDYLVRTVPVYQETKQFGLLRGLLFRSLQLVGIASLLLAGLGLIFGTIFVSGSAVTNTGAFVMGLTLLPLTALNATNGGALRGLGHVLLGQIPGELLRPLVFLLLVVAMRLTMPSYSPSLALGANAVSAFAALLVGLVLLRRVSYKQLRAHKLRTQTRAWLRGALPFSLLAGVQVINHHTDILMIGYMLGEQQTGLYRVATQTADGLGMVLIAITAVIAPQLARLHIRNDWLAIQRLLVISHRVGTILLVPLMLFFVFMGQRFLELAFGSGYIGAADALSILAAGKVAYATVGFSGIAISMFGFPLIATGATAVVAVLNVGLNYLWIPGQGIVGAAYATAVSAFVINAVLALWIGFAHRRNITALGRLHRDVG